MATEQKPVTTSLQASMVRAYKVFGLIALSIILLGLTSFLIVNLFYLLNRSWVRPVILDGAHHQVVDARAEIASRQRERNQAAHQRAELVAEKHSIGAQLAELERFEEDYEAVAQKAGRSSYPALMARRAVHQGRLETSHLEKRRGVIDQRIAGLDSELSRLDRLIDELERSPYYRAGDGQLYVAFVPYENLGQVQTGDRIYACKWSLVHCSQVGRVGARVPGEVEAKHPNSGDEMRGLMVELDLEEQSAATDDALFVDGRPLFLF